MGAIEGFDNMVNDALYGILYRDINLVRGLIDQRVSRMINGYFGVVINTGEDNYLRTADAMRGRAVGDRLAVHQPPAGARVGRARRADRARRRVRDRRPVHNGLLLRVGPGAADARAVPGLPGQVHAADAAHGRQPLPHARDRHAVQPRDDRHRAGHPDDRRADRGDLHAPRPRPRARPAERRLRVQRGRATSARRSSSSRAGSSRRAPSRCSAEPTSCSSGSPRRACSRRSSRRRFGDVSRSVDDGRGIEGIVQTADELLQPAARADGGGQLCVGRST